MADCQKDGTPWKTLVGFKSKPQNQFQGIDFTKPQLKQMIHAIKSHLLITGEIKRVLVARSDKGNETTFKHFDGANYIVAYDCGYLGFLRRLNYEIVQTFGKYIDPSSSRANDISFPNDDSALTIDRISLEFLGYTNSQLNSATSKGKDIYNYDIVIATNNLVNTVDKKNNNRNTDVHMENVFVGNAKKNTNDITSVLGKSMGDKLQVYIQFINYKINKTRNYKQYTVATCDEVVLLLCIILNLPCFYTSIDEVTLNGKKDVKVNEILHYDPDGANFGNALKRFLEEYHAVDSEYEHLILLLNRTSGKNVFLKGHDVTVKLNPLLVRIMIDDIKTIQKYIKEHLYDPAIERFKILKNGKILKDGSVEQEKVPLTVDDIKVAKGLEYDKKIIQIKSATNEMSAWTTRVVDMCPNPVIKLRGNGPDVTFNQTTSAYYDYGANRGIGGVQSDELILGVVIEKKYIEEFYIKTNEKLPEKGMVTLPFSNIAKAFAGFGGFVDSAGVTAGGGKKLLAHNKAHNKKMSELRRSERTEPLEEGEAEQQILVEIIDEYLPLIVEEGHIEDVEALRYFETDTIENKNLCWLDSRHISMEKEFPEVMPPDGFNLTTNEPRESFNIHEKYYDELLEIYEKIHENYEREGKKQFSFEEYVYAMEPILFKIRNYNTDTLVQNMVKLQYKFLSEFMINAQNELTVLIKMEMHDELKAKFKERNGANQPTKENVFSFIAEVETTQDVHYSTNPKMKELYGEVVDKLRGAVGDPDSIMYDLSQPEEEFNGGGRRTRNKTRRRHKQTHKRARKLRNRITKRRMKRGQKRNKTR
jgi:hypothetical protein